MKCNEMFLMSLINFKIILSNRVPVVLLMSSPEDDIVNVGEDIIPIILVIQETDPQPGSLHSHHLPALSLSWAEPRPDPGLT